MNNYIFNGVIMDNTNSNTVAGANDVPLTALMRVINALRGLSYDEAVTTLRNAETCLSLSMTGIDEERLSRSVQNLLQGRRKYL